MNIGGRQSGAVAIGKAVGEASHAFRIDHSAKVLNIESEAGDGNVGGVGGARFNPNILFDVDPAHGGGCATIYWSIAEKGNIGGLAIGEISLGIHESGHLAEESSLAGDVI